LNPPPIQQPTAAAIALAKDDQKSGFGRKVFIAIFAIIALIIIDVLADHIEKYADIRVGYRRADCAPMNKCAGKTVSKHV
jgi:hypothetical protein